MNFALLTNGRKRMLDFDPLHSFLSLRPFDFHRHLSALAATLYVVRTPGEFTHFE